MITPIDGDGSDGEPNKPFPGGNVRNQLNKQQYKFTQDEMRVIKDCNRESFYQRCLPLCTILGGSTFYGVKAGFLRPSPRFGAVPKVVAAVVVGYFVGKFSYQSKCAEKLMQLPNSHIGEMLRQRRRGNLRESLDAGFGPGMSLAPFSGMNPSNTYSDLNPNNSLDLDTNRPESPGLDEYHRPSVDNPIFEEEMPPLQRNATSYEELRKKNREEYQQKRLGNYREPQVQTAPPLTPQQPPPQNEDTYKPHVPKNQYGDTWG